jgi:SAM-dependent methyltransferase
VKHDRVRKRSGNGFETDDRVEEQPQGNRFQTWIAKLGTCRRVVDLGSGEMGHRRQWAQWLSSRVQYTSLDIQSRFRPTVIANVERLPIRNGLVDGILAMSVLEHVSQPWVAVKEIQRVLAPGGLVVGYVPYMWPYHADRTFHDYFRFSDEAIRSLFSNFAEIELVAAGSYVNTTLRFAAGFTAAERHLLRFEPFLRRLLGQAFADAIRKYPTRFEGLSRSPTGYQFLAVK